MHMRATGCVRVCNTTTTNNNNNNSVCYCMRTCGTRCLHSPLTAAANLRTKILDFRGSWEFPGRCGSSSLSRDEISGALVGRLGVARAQKGDLVPRARLLHRPPLAPR